MKKAIDKRIIFVLFLYLTVSLMAFPSTSGVFTHTQFPIEKNGDIKGAYVLESIDGELYACAYKNGIYKYSALTNSWDYWAMEGHKVIQFTLNGDEIIAIVDEGIRDDMRLMRYNKKTGEIADIFDPVMGTVSNGKNLSTLLHIAQNPYCKSMVIALTKSGIWKSEDYGDNWVFLNWDFHLRGTYFGWHPYKEGLIFNTGSDPFGGPSLWIGDDQGIESGIYGTYPTADYGQDCLGLAFDPFNSDRIIGLHHEVITESLDCGHTFKCMYKVNIIDTSKQDFIRDILFDPLNQDIVYALPYIDNGGVKLFKSMNGGFSWSLVAFMEEYNGEELYYKHSIYHDGNIYINTSAGVFKYDISDNTSVPIQQLSIERDSTIYDLNGRVIRNPEINRIYVRNGKKFIMH